MKKITRKYVKNDGTICRKENDIKHHLNYGIAKLLNKAVLNEEGLPIHYCDPKIYPDYIALNSEKSKYNFTPLTAVAFYSFDRTFDNINGLYNAIYYNNKRLLKKYKEKFKGVRFVIAPDYSLFDDIWKYENESRIFKIRVIMLWFVIEMNAIVIPNAIYLSLDKLKTYLSGFENCTVFCFSTKGHMQYEKDRERVKETLKYIIDNFPIKTILVYSVCSEDEKVLELFEYARTNGVDIRILDNTLRRRNKLKQNKGGSHE